MTPSISDLFLAYRQAKTALYFERRGVGLVELAGFESQLWPRLEALRSLLSENGGWFDGVPIGEVWLIPKALHSSPESQGVVRIGSKDPRGAVPALDVQLRLSPTPEFAIVEVLFLWKFGPALQSGLGPQSLGHRLDIRDGSLRRTSRWLFEYWPKRYQQFRTEPLLEAREALRRSGGAVGILSVDLAGFYDTIDPGFLLDQRFMGHLPERGEREQIDADEYRTAVKSLLSSYHSFRVLAERRTGIPWSTGIPIGALTSRLVANVSLATLDQAITTQEHVVCYRRYVDDLVIVERSTTSSVASIDDAVRRMLPHLVVEDGIFRFSSTALDRPGSDFQLQRKKCKLHHLAGTEGEDFISSIQRDFNHVVSEQRAFLEPSVLLEDAAKRLMRLTRGQDGPLRVLRDADRLELESFAVSATMKSLERVSVLVDPESARDLAQQTLDQIARFLAGDDDWAANFEMCLRLLRLGIATDDWDGARELNDGMDSIWGTVVDLRRAVRALFHRGRELRAEASWIWLRNYLHERRVEAICSSLRPTARQGHLPPWIRGGVRHRTRRMGSRALVTRANLLAAADLRARDREDDRFGLTAPSGAAGDSSSQALDSDLETRFSVIKRFVERCEALGDESWQMDPARLFLSTRPPSYFDIARRWLYRSESEGFLGSEFIELLDVVNAVRGTNYRDPIGQVVSGDTVEMPIMGLSSSLAPGDPRIILGNAVATDGDFAAAATRVAGSTVGRPNLSLRRLRALARILESARRLSRMGMRGSRRRSSLLVLPELSLPRPWFRAVADYAVRSGGFGLVAGLEYLHSPTNPEVFNQVFAVIPGPFMSAATWPWTKRRPAEVEKRELNKLGVAFPKAPKRPRSRTVVRSPYGDFSVLICSELIESRLCADLLGRVELVLAPSWNTDTASYDHLIQSVGLQLHAIVAVANNGHYSDCRAWAPYGERWRRDLCRLIERDVDDVVVYVDIPLRSLRMFHAGSASREQQVGTSLIAGVAKAGWQPLPPDWP